MFEIKQPSSVKLEHVQTRMEGHGEELVPAVDMHFTWVTGSSVLTMLHPRLRSTLFMAKRDGEAEEPELDLPWETELPYVRLPNLGFPLKLNGEQLEMDVVIACGEGSLELQHCRLKKWRVTPLEGGTVELGFLVQCSSEIDEIVCGWLDMWQQRLVDLVLTSGEASSMISGQGDIADTRELSIAENVPDGKPSRRKRQPKEYITGEEP